MKHERVEALIRNGLAEEIQGMVRPRRWARAILRNALLCGFVLDMDRLMDSPDRDDYWAHLQACIEELRLSQRSTWQRLTDLYALACDYDLDSTTTRTLYDHARKTPGDPALLQRLLDHAEAQASARLPMTMADWSGTMMSGQSE